MKKNEEGMENCQERKLLEEIVQHVSMCESIVWIQLIKVSIWFIGDHSIYLWCSLRQTLEVNTSMGVLCFSSTISDNLYGVHTLQLFTSFE